MPSLASPSVCSALIGSLYTSLSSLDLSHFSISLIYHVMLCSSDTYKSQCLTSLCAMAQEQAEILNLELWIHKNI